MTKYLVRSNLREGWALFWLVVLEDTVHPWQKGVAASHIVSIVTKQSTDRKWGQAMKPQDLPPVATSSSRV